MLGGLLALRQEGVSDNDLPGPTWGRWGRDLLCRRALPEPASSFSRVSPCHSPGENLSRLSGSSAGTSQSSEATCAQRTLPLCLATLVPILLLVSS